MKRGEVWTVAGGGDYSAKRRPAVIVQDDGFADTPSITVCLVTTSDLMAPEAELIRVPVSPTPTNGLKERSFVMTDKVVTLRRERFGSRLGELEESELLRINVGLMLYLGLGR